MQMFGLSDSKQFDIYSQKKREGSIKFRAEKWEEDFNKYTDLDFTIQLFGIGVNKYHKISEKRWGVWDNFKGTYAAHNGYLIILVERGILGLILFLAIIFQLTSSSFKVIKINQVRTPVIYLFLFIALYSFSQNEELVNIYSYLFMGGAIGNIYYYSKLDNVDK